MRQSPAGMCELSHTWAARGDPCAGTLLTCAPRRFQGPLTAVNALLRSFERVRREILRIGP